MLQDICTVFWRDWVVLKRRLPKFILSRMVAPMLYLVAFGWGLGRNIQVGSGSYLDFLVPGIMALNSMNISYNSLTPLCTERIYHRSIGEYIIAPMHFNAFIIGKILAAVLRGLISSAIIMILALAFGTNLNITPLFVGILILNCIIFAEVGFFAAMKMDSYEELSHVLFVRYIFQYADPAGGLSLVHRCVAIDSYLLSFKRNFHPEHGGHGVSCGVGGLCYNRFYIRQQGLS